MDAFFFIVCCSCGVPFFFFHRLNKNKGNNCPGVNCMTVVVIGYKEAKKPEQSAGLGNRAEEMEL